jgi:hypothetical protein
LGIRRFLKLRSSSTEDDGFLVEGLLTQRTGYSPVAALRSLKALPVSHRS